MSSASSSSCSTSRVILDFTKFATILADENYVNQEAVQKVVSYLQGIDSTINNNKDDNHRKMKFSAETEQTLSKIKERFIKQVDFKGNPKLVEAVLNLDCLNTHLNAQERIDFAKQTPDLENFDTHKTKLTDEQLIEIVDTFHQLTSLNIRRCDSVTQVGFAALKRLTQLTSLYLSMTENLINEDLNSLPSNLRNLWMRKCTKISTEGIKILSKKTPDLELLVIRGCDIDDDSMPYVLTFKKLTNLDLHRCPKLSDRGLAVISGSTGIKIFSIRDNKQVTDAGVLHFTSAYKNLEELIVGGCGKLTDLSLKHISQCSQLTKLDVRENDNFTDEGLLPLAGALPHLTELRVEKCTKITEKSLKAFSDKGVIINRGK